MNYGLATFEVEGSLEKKESLPGLAEAVVAASKARERYLSSIYSTGHEWSGQKQ